MNGEVLRARLSAEFPRTNPRLIAFPSGSFMLDLDMRGETYVIEYVAGLGCGISKQSDATFGWEGVETVLETTAQLENRIRDLMRGSR